MLPVILTLDNEYPIKRETKRHRFNIFLQLVFYVVSTLQERNICWLVKNVVKIFKFDAFIYRTIEILKVRRRSVILIQFLIN